VGRKSTESHPPPALQNIEQVCNRMSSLMESVFVQFADLNLPQGKVSDLLREIQFSFTGIKQAWFCHPGASWSSLDL